MRKTPSASAEVVSQALYAEAVTCIQELGSWVHIRTSDEYEGWVPKDAITSLQEAYHPTMFTSRLSVPLYLQTTSDVGLNLPFGVGLKVMSEEGDWFGVELPTEEKYFIRKGNLESPKTLNKQDLVGLSYQFLGLSYIWGGRSSFGYDCSGFVQMLYKQMDIQLPRDSGPQSRDPRFQDIDQNDLQKSDLIFWGLSRDKIHHVGLYIGEGQFIHATAREQKPWIRISSLTDSAWNCDFSGRTTSSVYPYRLFRARSC